MNSLLFIVAIWHGWYTSYKYPELQKRFEEFQRRKRQYRDRWGHLNDAVIECLGAIRALADEVEVRRTDYQQANRQARSDVNNSTSLPAYFTNGTKLSLEYPKEIQVLLSADDPTDKFHETMLENPHHKQLKEAEEAIAKVDEVLEGKTA
jgi:chromosome segregation ATPase